MQPMLEPIREQLFDTDDLIVRDFELGGQAAKLVYLESMCDLSKLETSVFKQWFNAKSDEYGNLRLNDLLTSAAVQACCSADEAVQALMTGQALVGASPSRGIGYAFSAEQTNVRSIHEPENERSIVGERAGFVEQLHINTNFIRSRASTGQLKMRYIMLGKQKLHKVAVYG